VLWREGIPTFAVLGIAWLGSALPRLDLGRTGADYGFLLVFGLASLPIFLAARRTILGLLLPAFLVLLPAIGDRSACLVGYGELLPQIAVGLLGAVLVRTLQRRYGEPVAVEP
jgi:hypothetical protein